MKEPDASERSIADSLERMQKAGTEFFVDGEPVSLKEAVKYAVLEDHAYMADYVVGPCGKVEQVRLDKVDLS
nr:hypothetical protein [uncultured Acetatifactor sp.]